MVYSIAGLLGRTGAGGRAALPRAPPHGHDRGSGGRRRRRCARARSRWPTTASSSSTSCWSSPRPVLEALRQPLEDRHVSLVRARRTISYPADFMLVAALNPCPCGHRGSPLRTCTCSVAGIAAYRARLSGPLLDRIDLHVDVPALPYRELAHGRLGPSRSAAVRQRVEEARGRQRARGTRSNARLTSPELEQVAPIDADGHRAARARPSNVWPCRRAPSAASGASRAPSPTWRTSRLCGRRTSPKPCNFVLSIAPSNQTTSPPPNNPLPRRTHVHHQRENEGRRRAPSRPSKSSSAKGAIMPLSGGDIAEIGRHPHRLGRARSRARRRRPAARAGSSRSTAPSRPARPR